MISIPGNSASRWRAITSSSGMNVSLAISTNRGSTSLGTFTRANASWSSSGSCSRTIRLSDRFEMYGNGRPGPTASGVSTGKICSRKWRSITFAGAPDSSQVTIRIPCSASAGRTTSVNWRAWRRSSSRTVSAIRSSTSVGDRPSGPRASIRASTWSCTPATRTMKNSSRLVTKIARNFSRSISGSDSSSASCSTRSLKSSQDSSRLMYSAGSVSSTVAVRSPSVAAAAAPDRRWRWLGLLERLDRSRDRLLGVGDRRQLGSAAAARPARPWRPPPGRPCASAPGRR